MPWQLGTGLGGALSPGHAMRNRHWRPDSPANVMGGPNMGHVTGQTPQGAWYAQPRQSAWAPPPMPSSAGFGSELAKIMGGSGGQGGPPRPSNPYVTSSIPFGQMQSQYLPESVSNVGRNQQFSNYQRQASVQPIFESYGATGENQASAASGQYQPLIQARMQDDLQKGAMVTGDVPVAAAMQKYDFGTKGHGLQSDEVQGLGALAESWYGDRLNTWNQRQAAQAALANLIMG